MSGTHTCPICNRNFAYLYVSPNSDPATDYLDWSGICFVCGGKIGTKSAASYIVANIKSKEKAMEPALTELKKERSMLSSF